MRIDACVAARDRPVAPDTAPRRTQRTRLVQLRLVARAVLKSADLLYAEFARQR